jgi:hypothetical protein
VETWPWRGTRSRLSQIRKAHDPFPEPPGYAPLPPGGAAHASAAVRERLVGRSMAQVFPNTRA